MKNRLIVLCLCLCLTNSACASKAPDPAPPPMVSDIHTMEQLLELVNRNHQAVEKPVVDFEAYIHQFSDAGLELFQYAEPVGFDPAAVLTQDALLEDCDTLFLILQNSYGAYYHFGGEQAFSQAKQEILNPLLEMEEVTGEMLLSSLWKHLAFVRDSHFTIGQQQLGAPVFAYQYRTLPFSRTANGFASMEDGRQVESVEGYLKLEELFQLSITDDGQVAYFPVVLWEGDGEPGSLTIHFTHGETLLLTHNGWQSKYDQTERMMDLTFQDGVPVMFVRTMGFDQALEDEYGRTFLNWASEYREEPVVVVDLRSNYGGNGILPLKWLEAFTGSPVTTNFSQIMYWSERDMLDFVGHIQNPYYNSYEDFVEVAGTYPISDHYLATKTQPDCFVENDSVLIILTSKHTSSAAETFVDAAQNVANTLIIGENTYGMGISNAYTTIYLPNSGIPVQFGCNLSLFPEGQFEEYIGYRPDLWVDGDAQEYALKLIGRLAQDGE